MGGERGGGTQSCQRVPIFLLLPQPLAQLLALGFAACCWHGCLLPPGGHLAAVVVPYTSPSPPEVACSPSDRLGRPPGSPGLEGEWGGCCRQSQQKPQGVWLAPGNARGKGCCRLPCFSRSCVRTLCITLRRAGHGVGTGCPHRAHGLAACSQGMADHTPVYISVRTHAGVAGVLLVPPRDLGVFMFPVSLSVI